MVQHLAFRHTTLEDPPQVRLPTQPFLLMNGNLDGLELLAGFYGKRPNKTCDSMPLNFVIWKDFYDIKFAISEGKAAHMLMMEDGEPFSAIPACAEEDLPYFFNEIVDYFNQILKKPLVIALADETAIQALNLDPEQFDVVEIEKYREYLYCAESLRTLADLNLAKRRRELNRFTKNYEGRYEYRALCESDYQEVCQLVDRWRENKGEDVEEHLDYEIRAIKEIFQHCRTLQNKIGGVFVDGKLEAFSIGSYNSL